MAEDMAAKARRLASEYTGARPAPAPKPTAVDRPTVTRMPVRMANVAVPSHTPAQLQAFVQREQQEAQQQAESAMSMMARAKPEATDSTSRAMAELQKLSGAQAPPEPPRETAVDAPESPLSTFDIEIVRLSDQLDPAELVTHGYITAELDIVPGVLSVSVKTLKKADWVDVHKDVDEFRRGGRRDPSDENSEWITPFPSAVTSFMNTRYLAQGVLGVNGEAWTANWAGRFARLEELDDSVYSAILREYDKLLMATRLLFPDNATKEILAKLRSRLGKAQAHQ